MIVYYTIASELSNTTRGKKKILVAAVLTALAMAALKPIQYDPMEPTQVMAGVGNYRGETAAALGLAHYTNENTMLNVGASFGSHNMVNAGVTHKFGYSPEKKISLIVIKVVLLALFMSCKMK